jgi:hypothetical protein
MFSIRILYINFEVIWISVSLGSRIGSCFVVTGLFGVNLRVLLSFKTCFVSVDFDPAIILSSYFDIWLLFESFLSLSH